MYVLYIYIMSISRHGIYRQDGSWDPATMTFGYLDPERSLQSSNSKLQLLLQKPHTYRLMCGLLCTLQPTCQTLSNVSGLL